MNACQKGEINSLNTPVVGAIISNPTRSDLFNLVTGVESGMRNNYAGYLDCVGVIGVFLVQTPLYYRPAEWRKQCAR